MHSERVETNRSCVLLCEHCACSSRESPEVVKAAPRAIARAVETGCACLILCGGEPLLRRDLARLIAFAKRGAKQRALRVELSTTAIGLDSLRALELRAAGLDRVRVSLPGWGADYEAITRVPDSFAAALAGTRAAADAGLEVEFEIPLLRSNLAHVHELAGRVLTSFEQGAIRGLRLRRPSDDRDPPALRDVAAAIERCDDALRGLGSTLELALDPERMPPPCCFRRPTRVAHLFTLTRGGVESPHHRHLQVCGECTLADRCPGVPTDALARESAPVVSPITDDRTRRRLSQITSVEQQMARELVSRELGRSTSGEAWLVHTIRVHFPCNQACDFCFVSTHLPAPPEAAVRAAIVAAAGEGAAIALSGGEPTLEPKLVEYIRFARDQGVRAIELQTNATRLADPELSATIVAAGVDVVFVSLHGSRAEISDSITRAPGTFERTLAGLDRLAELGQRTRLNFVMCRSNAQDFPAVVDLVARRWPSFEMTFSFVAPSTDLVPRTPELIPRYTEVVGSLLAGLRRAEALGVRVHGFESMCAIPLCLKPDGLGEYEALAGVDESMDRGEFEKPAACTTCSQRSRCWGLRSGYLALHGADELRPFA